jgi:hypothetical protein
MRQSSSPRERYQRWLLDATHVATSARIALVAYQLRFVTLWGIMIRMMNVAPARQRDVRALWSVTAWSQATDGLSRNSSPEQPRHGSETVRLVAVSRQDVTRQVPVASMAKRSRRAWLTVLGATHR